MTIEARLTTALLLLLVFAAGTLPSRQTQAVLVQLAAQIAPHNGSGRQAAKERIGAPAVIAEKPAAETEPSAGDPAEGVRGSDELVLLNQDRLQAGIPAEGVRGSDELVLLNQDRLQAGIPALAESASLDRIALTRAAQVIGDGVTHTRPGHSQLAAVELLQASGIPYTWHGENIIWEGGLPLGQVAAFFNEWWMASPAHRANILNPHYRSVGIGVAQSGDRVYMVEVFTDTPALSETPTLTLPLRGRERTTPR